MGQDLEMFREFLNKIEDSLKLKDDINKNEIKIAVVISEVENLKNQISKIEKTMEQSKILTISTLVTALMTLAGIVLK